MQSNAIEHNTIQCMQWLDAVQRVPESGVSGEWGDDQTVSLNQILNAMQSSNESNVLLCLSSLSFTSLRLLVDE